MNWDQIFVDNGSEVFVKLIQRMFTENGVNVKWRELQERLVADSMVDSEKEYLDKMLKDLERIIMDPISYFEDIMSAVYIGLLYSDPKQDSFANRLGFRENRPKEESELLYRFEKDKCEIASVWSSKSNDEKINKKSVKENYPVPIYENDEENSIRSLPGGCFRYHHTLISKDNISIFDIKTEMKSFKRYSFVKMYRIYDELKDTLVENLLLMEYSLGVGYASQIFHYTKEMEKTKELEQLNKLVELGAQIVPFFIRKKVMSVLWEYLHVKGFDKNCVDNYVLVILTAVKDMVMKVYMSSLELCWKICFRHKNEKLMYYIERILLHSWLDYYNANEVYKEMISECEVHDWRGINKVEDCFAFVRGYPEHIMSKGIIKIESEVVLDMCKVSLQDYFGNYKIIYVERPINELGMELLRLTMEKINREKLPDNDMEIYRKYYSVRNNIYKELLKKEKLMLKGKDIKMPSTNLKPQHVYALLQKEIISTLLRKELVYENS